MGDSALPRAPEGARRIVVSLSSANEFFDRKPLSMIDEGGIEAYKAWRFNEHDVSSITVRRDLHSMSTFFQYAIKQILDAGQSDCEYRDPVLRRSGSHPRTHERRREIVLRPCVKTSQTCTTLAG